MKNYRALELGAIPHGSSHGFVLHERPKNYKENINLDGGILTK